MQNKKLLIILAVALVFIAGGVGVYYFTQQRQAPSQTIVESPAVVAATATPTTVGGNSGEIEPGSLITSVQLSDSSQGLSISPITAKAVFTDQTEVIYGAVLLSPDVVDQNLNIKIVYETDKSELGPITTDIKNENEQKFASFTLKKPVSGWPSGSYTIVVALPSGGSVESPFIVQ